MDRGTTACKLLERLATLRDAGTLTDFEVVCGERKWKVHQAVLAMHSEVMLKACTGEFKEAHERKLDLSVHGLACVERLVAYMYALDYEGGVVDEIQIDVRIYGLADMFDIAALKETALAKFKQDISAWDVKFVKAHQALIVDTIRAAYDGPYPSICEPLVHKLVGLCGRSEDVTAPLLDLIEEIPTFGKDLAKQMTKALAKNKRIKRPDERRYVCPSMGEWCKATFRARIGESMETVTCYACQASFPASKWEALATDE